MEKNNPNRKQCAQKKYRRSQSHKGLIRLELQVSLDTKVRFDALVAAVAEEYPEPWDPRRRLAKARNHIFDEITKGVVHEFFTLKEEIQALKTEIKALSPQFFQLKEGLHPTPLPKAIAALPDDPQMLKKQLAKTHQDMQSAKREALNYRRLAQQYEQLYEAHSNYNEELKCQLEKYTVSHEKASQ